MLASESQQIRTKIEQSEYSENSNFQSYSHSQYLEPRKEKPRKNEINDIVQGKWSEEQKMKYILFVYHHSKIFKSKTKRKNLRVFKTLSEYLGSRTPRQCRSHFQKLMNRFKNLKKMIEHHQNSSGMSQFMEAHKSQTVLIQSYPLQGQSLQKPTVACQEVGCQTEFPDLAKQHENALLRIKALEQIIYQPNYLLRHPQNCFYPPPNLHNYPRY